MLYTSEIRSVPSVHRREPCPRAAHSFAQLLNAHAGPQRACVSLGLVSTGKLGDESHFRDPRSCSSMSKRRSLRVSMISRSSRRRTLKHGRTGAVAHAYVTARSRAPSGASAGRNVGSCGVRSCGRCDSARRCRGRRSNPEGLVSLLQLHDDEAHVAKIESIRPGGNARRGFADYPLAELLVASSAEISRIVSRSCSRRLGRTRSYFKDGVPVSVDLPISACRSRGYC